LRPIRYARLHARRMQILMRPHADPHAPGAKLRTKPGPVLFCLGAVSRNGQWQVSELSTRPPSAL
jgi:hypothetical protein